MLASLFQVFVPMVGGVLLLGICLAVITSNRWFRSRQGRRSPFKGAFLRLPGHTLRHEIRGNTDDVATAFAAVLGAIMYIGGYAAAKMTNARPSQLSIAAWTVCLTIAALLLGLYVWKKMDRIRILRLALDGEVAVAEECEKLATAGYRTFHDVPGPNYNFDHVLIGPNGVFVLETKSRSKPDKEYTATFEGNAIEFPGFRDTASIEQARRNAKTLANWLQTRVGRPIAVRSMVVIPHWRIEQRSPARDVFVVSSGQLQRWVPKITGCLPEEDIQAAIGALDDVCRTESPIPLIRADRERFSKRNVVN